MKAETLKKAILQYAMEGKLVAQDPNDEPASELLKRIKAEKEQLIKDGKIKKEKPLQPITEDEIPYELPQGWEWVRLGEISNINGGYAFKSSDLQDSGVRVIRISDFDENGFKNHKVVRIQYDSAFSDYKLETGNILLAMTGGTVGKSYFVQDDIEDMYVNQRVATIKITEYLTKSYINFVILSPLTQNKIDESKNSTNDNISMNTINEFLIPLPPLEEQKRIVEMLEEILPLVEEYGKNEEKLSKLNETLPKKIRQSILQHAVQGKLVAQDQNDEPASELLKRIKAEKEQLIKDGKIKKEKPLPPITEDEIPYELPQGWEWVRLSDIGELSRGKSKHRPRNDKKLFGGIYPFIQTGDIARSKVYVKTHTQTYNEIGLAQSRLFPKNTLCITIAANIGDTAILSYDACFPDSVVGFIPIKELTNVMYIFYFLQIAKNQLEKYAPATAQKNINLGILDKLSIPLPPLEEQKRIVAKVDELMQLVDKLK